MAKGVSGAVATVGVLIPALLAIRIVSPRRAQAIPPLVHRCMSRSLGVRVAVEGELADGGVLYVSNHLSWMDIPVLGSRLKGSSFVAKSEVGAMGPVGLLADLQETIYVERERRTASAAQADTIAARLRAGRNVILFPEGTTNDGVHMLPFKSTLFAVLDAPGCADIPIQPISIAYTRLNGMPMTRNRLIDIAWIGDLDLGAHAFQFMGMGRFGARIRAHPPVRRRDFADRKALARHCQQAVARGYREMIRGHA